MLCVWWNFEGVVHFELIPNGQGITAELYSQQLHRVNMSLHAKYTALVNRKRVLLHYNARPHSSLKTLQKINGLGWELLPHPAYSLDLAPSDYHLLRSMAHFLVGRRFKNEHEVKEGCQAFFVSKDPNWYRRGIKLFAERWVNTEYHRK